MKAPVVALKQPGNHGPHAGSICKKICPQRPQPGKYDYFAQPESYSRSGAWEFFTEDWIVVVGRAIHAGLLRPRLEGPLGIGDDHSIPFLRKCGLLEAEV